LKNTNPREGKNGQDQFVTGKTGVGNLAEIGRSLMDFLVQPAFCHLPMGKAGG